MIRKTLALLGILKILALSTPAMANDAPVEKLYVYGRVCKAVNLQGTHQTIQDALEAAAKHRGEGMTEVSVRTGNHDIHDEHGTAATHHRVYRRNVRCGRWILHATLDSAAKAKEMVDEMSKKNPLAAVEIVRHYGKFSVYGGQCAKDIRLQRTYETLADACAAAQKFRSDKLKYVHVRTGHNTYFSRPPAPEYQVYRRGCKGNWSLHATVDSATKAKEIGDQLTKSSPRIEVEIVHHYSN